MTAAKPSRPVPGDDPAAGLELRAISKRFGKHQVLRDVSLRVRRGEVVGLFGRDGAGKTICFEAIMGLTGVESGQVLLDDRDITRLTIDRRAPLGLSFLPQETSIFREMTTAQNIAAVLELLEPDKALREPRLDALLEQFDITYVRDTPATRLSGGERRRCEVARAMAQSPSIMLFDEPFSGIDPMTVNSIVEVISGLRHHDVGVLITDQNIPAMIGLIERAYVLHMGEVIFAGSVDEMLADELVHKVYLGAKNHVASHR